MVRQQFEDSDQVVGDQIEQQVGNDPGSATMFDLTHHTVLLTPTEDAFGLRSARLRHAIAFMPRRSSVNGARAAFTD